MNRAVTLFSLFVLLVLTVQLAVGARSPEGEVRSAAEKVFADLKAGRYEQLYESLPASSRQRVARDRFISSLRKTEEFYKLDRLEIGAVRVKGNVAVADTVIYGHVYRPIDSDGKIVAQQYMVRENGTWRVATGDRILIQRFLDQNPDFAKKFPLRPPRVYIKRDGQWIDVSAIRQGRVST